MILTASFTSLLFFRPNGTQRRSRSSRWTCVTFCLRPIATIDAGRQAFGSRERETDMPNRRTPAAHELISLEASRKVQDAIGRALEAHYVELVREPIPDRLLELLAELEAGELRHE